MFKVKRIISVLFIWAFIVTVCSGENLQTYIGTKAPGVAKEVGDIVFNDGSATPYTEDLSLTDAQKVAAIAVIYYKGTDFNNSGDTTTIRTLGVGLKHDTSGIAWCLETADAYDKDIEAIGCVGGNREQSYLYTGDRNGSDNFEVIATFKGVNDTEIETNYPAFYFAKNYKNQKIGSETSSRIISGSEFENGWYLPSIPELDWIYECMYGSVKRLNIDAIIELCGGDKFDSNWYWSSNQAGISPMICLKCAFGIYFGDGCCYDCYRFVNERSVCAIREFN